MTLDELYAFVWWYCTRNADEQDREKFRADLWRPPKGIIAETGPWSAEGEAQAFQAFKAATTAK